jgi:hypothetical protein
MRIAESEIRLKARDTGGRGKVMMSYLGKVEMSY